MDLNQLKVQLKGEWEHTKKLIPPEILYRAGEDALHFVFLYAWKYGEIAGYKRGHLEMAEKVERL